MKKLYGDSIRKDAGLTKTLKNVAKKNASVARVAQEVSGTFEKVYDEAASAVEDFLSRCKSNYITLVELWAYTLDSCANFI